MKFIGLRYVRGRPFHVLWCLLVGGLVLGQDGGGVADTIGRMDVHGRRQGWWRLVAPQDGKPAYAPGRLIEEGRYESGKRTGIWRRYWPTGELMSEITYVMGRPRGPYTTYYPDGWPEEQGSWDADRNTGSFKRWHSNGKLAQEFIFDDNGVRNGVQRYYHENGQLAVEVTVKDGREEGTLKRYRPDGSTEQIAEFDEGVIDAANSRFIKPAGTSPVVKPDTSAPVAPAVSTEEKPNAATFRDNGYNTLYDKQLRLSQVGDFRNGRLWHGKVYKYDRDGALVKIEVYVEGRYAGTKPITEEDKP